MTDLPAPSLTHTNRPAAGPGTRLDGIHPGGTGAGDANSGAVRPGGSGPATAASLVLAVLLAGLDQTVVATALPSVAGELPGPGEPIWILLAYLLAFAIALPVLGNLGEQLDRRRVFQISIGLFLTGSALCGQAGTVEELVMFRVLQGVGAGGVLIGAQTLVHDLAPGRGRARFVGVLGATFGLAALAGPLVGGLLTTYASWRWCFFLNVPLGASALLASRQAGRIPTAARGFRLRTTSRRSGSRPHAPARPVPGARFDLAGSLLLAAFSTGLVLVAAWGGRRYAWDSPALLGLAGGTLVALGLFVLVERIAREPVLPLRLFRSGRFVVTGLIMLPVGAAGFGLLLLLPLYWQLAGGATPVETGLLLLPVVGGLVLAALAAAWWLARGGGCRLVAAFGMSAATVGLTAVSFLDEQTGRLTYGVVTALTGAGLGLALSGSLVAADRAGVAASDDLRRPGSSGERGDAAGIAGATYLRTLGGCVGAAVLGALALTRLPPPGTDAPVADGGTLPPMSALTSQFVLLVPALAVGFLLTLALRDRRPEPDFGLGEEWESGWDEEEQDDWDTMPFRTGTPALAGRDTDAPAADGESGPPPMWITVYESSGAPVSGVTLTLTSLAGRQVARADTVDPGGYRLTPPEPGTYLAIASAPGYQPQALILAYEGTGGYAELTLCRERGVFGRVSRTDGEPVEGATVTLTDHDGEVVATQTTDASGEYEVRDLPATSYTLAVSARAYRPAARGVEVPHAGTVRQDVELIGGARLHGIVRGKPGRRPLPDARVTLIDSAGQVRSVTTADLDGAFRFVDVPEGEYTLVATAQPPAAEPVRIHGGEDHEHDMELCFPRDPGSSPILSDPAHPPMVTKASQPPVRYVGRPHNECPEATE